jgi:hypothetical protein
MHKNFLSKFHTKQKFSLKKFVFSPYYRALLSAVTDEIRANKLADTNIINDLLGFSSESQVRRREGKENEKMKGMVFEIRYYVNNAIVYQSQKQMKHLSH